MLIVLVVLVCIVLLLKQSDKPLMLAVKTFFALISISTKSYMENSLK